MKKVGLGILGLLVLSSLTVYPFRSIKIAYAQSTSSASEFLNKQTSTYTSVAELVIQKPELHIGDSWMYTNIIYGPWGEFLFYSEKVVGVEDWSGQKIYVINYQLGKVHGEVGLNGTRWMTEDWAYVKGIREYRDGDIMNYTYNPPARFWDFPLYVGKEWTNTYNYSWTEIFKDGSIESGSEVRVEFNTVVDEQTVTIAGNTFETLVIRSAYENYIEYYWFSSAVKNMVKYERYANGSLEESMVLMPHEKPLWFRDDVSLNSDPASLYFSLLKGSTVTFSPDSEYFALNTGTQVFLFKTDSQQVISKFDATGIILEVKLSRNAEKILTVSFSTPDNITSYQLFSFDGESAKKVWSDSACLPVAFLDLPTHLAEMSEDGECVTFYSSQNEIQILFTDTLERYRVVDVPSIFALSPSGYWLATFQQYRIKIINIKERRVYSEGDVASANNLLGFKVSNNGTALCLLQNFSPPTIFVCKLSPDANATEVVLSHPLDALPSTPCTTPGCVLYEDKIAFLYHDPKKKPEMNRWVFLDLLNNTLWEYPTVSAREVELLIINSEGSGMVTFNYLVGNYENASSRDSFIELADNGSLLWTSALENEIALAKFSPNGRFVVIAGTKGVRVYPTTTVHAPDLQLTVMADKNSIAVGETAIATVTLRNNGGADAKNVDVSVSLGTWLDLVSGSTPWHYDSLSVGASDSRSLTVRGRAEGSGTVYVQVTYFDSQGNSYQKSAFVSIEVCSTKAPVEPSSIDISLSSSTTSVNQPISVSGSLTPTITTSITLTFTKPDGSQVTNAVTTDAAGKFTYQFTPDQAGTWKVQASWEGNEKYFPAKSDVLSFEVKPPTPSLVDLNQDLKEKGITIEKYDPAYLDVSFSPAAVSKAKTWAGAWDLATSLLGAMFIKQYSLDRISAKTILQNAKDLYDWIKSVYSGDYETYLLTFTAFTDTLENTVFIWATANGWVSSELNQLNADGTMSFRALWTAGAIAKIGSAAIQAFVQFIGSSIGSPPPANFTAIILQEQQHKLNLIVQSGGTTIGSGFQSSNPDGPFFAERNNSQIVILPTAMAITSIKVDASQATQNLEQYMLSVIRVSNDTVTVTNKQNLSIASGTVDTFSVDPVSLQLTPTGGTPQYTPYIIGATVAVVLVAIGFGLARKRRRTPSK